MRFVNIFHGTLLRKGKVIHEHRHENLVTIEGGNAILNTMFRSAAQSPNWYVGLITGANPTVSPADTLVSKAWSEFSDYSGNRPAYLPDPASAGGIINGGTVATFNITNGGTIGGAFLTNVNTGTAGLLFSASAYPSGYPVVTSDVYRIAYTIKLIN